MVYDQAVDMNSSELLKSMRRLPKGSLLVCEPGQVAVAPSAWCAQVLSFNGQAIYGKRLLMNISSARILQPLGNVVTVGQANAWQTLK